MPWLPRGRGRLQSQRGAGDRLHAGQGSGAMCTRHSRGAVESALGGDLGRGGSYQKFGVPPASIPDYLALVGDAADGYPGLPGWGANRPPRYWRSSGAWNAFRRIGANGM